MYWILYLFMLSRIPTLSTISIIPKLNRINSILPLFSYIFLHLILKSVLTVWHRLGALVALFSPTARASGHPITHSLSFYILFLSLKIYSINNSRLIDVILFIFFHFKVESGKYDSQNQQSILKLILWVQEYIQLK